MSDATFRVMLRMQIKPGMEADFEQMWKEVGGSVTNHPANRGQWLSRSTTVDEDDIYYIISDWVDEPQFRQFETSDTHLQHRTRLHPYRSGGSMATMNIVASLSRTAA
ncbi:MULTISPECIES: antibiotic biosynthesis monooxygenase family protein [Streptomyces]|uniref:Antibiotic biosynthesis monooxygenase n=1 Tax=Streptomyces sp. NBC_00093 TaxID=2975649 RepID=A0AAU1ZYC4_9ACTN